MQKNKKFVLKLGTQTYQVLTKNDEVCIPSLSSIFLAVNRQLVEAMHGRPRLKQVRLALKSFQVFKPRVVMRTKNDFKKSHLLLSRWSRWSFFRICVARFREVFIFGRPAEKFEMYNLFVKLI